ncbi:MAG: NAD(P)/FAD-dependent oxidoreductase, partial [Pauljensenia sp.]
LVTGMDADSVTVRDAEGNTERIPSVCKVWAAGVQGSPLGRVLAERTGADLDRAGRVRVESDLTVPGHPEVFVIGDLMAVEGVPGVAQGAIQSAHFVADLISARMRGRAPRRRTFSYRDKGSMATIARFKAVVSVGRVKMSGFLAWMAWCFLHLLYIVGFKQQVMTLFHWFISFLSRARSERTTTNQQMVARLALERLGEGSSGRLVTGEE